MWLSLFDGSVRILSFGWMELLLMVFEKLWKLRSGWLIYCIHMWNGFFWCCGLVVRRCGCGSGEIVSVYLVGSVWLVVSRWLSWVMVLFKVGMGCVFFVFVEVVKFCLR